MKSMKTILMLAMVFLLSQTVSAKMVDISPKAKTPHWELVEIEPNVYVWELTLG